MHDFDMRQNRPVVHRDAVHILDDALFNRKRRLFAFGFRRQESPVLIVRNLIERRDIDAFDLRGAAQKFRASAGAPFPFPHFQDFDEFAHHLFAFSDKKQIEEIGDRLRIVHARPAGDDERIRLRARLRVKRIERNAGKRKHIEDIRVAHFIRKRKTEHVKIADRAFRFQRKKRKPPLPHECFHIHPRRIDALGQSVVSFIDDAVNDFQPQMAHGDFVHIRKRQRHAHIDRIVVLDDAVPFAADIARRFFDMHQPYRIDPDSIHHFLLTLFISQLNICRFFRQ